MSVWSGTSGQLDEVPLPDIRRFDKEFLDYLRRDKDDLLVAIRDTGDLSDDTIAGLDSAIADFKQQFRHQ